MTFHIYDFIGWIVVLIIYWIILPRQYKEEFGIFICWLGAIIITIIWIIIFGVFDLNVSDILDSFTFFNSPINIAK